MKLPVEILFFTLILFNNSKQELHSSPPSLLLWPQFHLKKLTIMTRLKFTVLLNQFPAVLVVQANLIRAINFRVAKPISENVRVCHVHQSELISSSHARRSNIVSASNICPSKTVSAINVCPDKLVCTNYVDLSK